MEQAGLGWLSCRWLWFETQKAWFSCFFLAKRIYFGVQPNWPSLEWGNMIFLVPVPPPPPSQRLDGQSRRSRRCSLTVRMRGCSCVYDGGQECGTGRSGLLELQVALVRNPIVLVFGSLYTHTPSATQRLEGQSCRSRRCFRPLGTRARFTRHDGGQER